MDAIDIDISIQKLAAEVADEPSTVRIWTVARLASAIGLDAILTGTEDPVEAIVEVGEMWADQVAQQLEDEPHRRVDTLRAAHSVVQRLLAVTTGQPDDTRFPRAS